MKKNLIIFFFLFSIIVVAAQTKPQRHIYLWDVTLSMHGYPGGKSAPYRANEDIYASVINFLEQDINKIKTGENSEIIVLPFQTQVMVTVADWTVRATEKGKNDIIQKIRNYPEQGSSNTNIVVPVRFVMDNILKPDKENKLMLLTDGKQTGGNAELLKIIEEWGKNAERMNAFAYYVMLNKIADDPNVRNKIANTPRIVDVRSYILHPQETIAFNIKEDKGKPVNVELTCKESVALPNNIKIKVESNENQYITVNEECVVENEKIAFHVKLKDTDSIINDSLPADTETLITLALKVVDQEEEMEQGRLVTLNKETIQLKLIKKQEKTLKIYYE